MKIKKILNSDSLTHLSDSSEEPPTLQLDGSPTRRVGDSQTHRVGESFFDYGYIREF
jgi:hypothetical protein